MKRPLTGLVLAYASGIWIGSLVNWPVPGLLMGATGWRVALAVLYRTRLLLAALVGFVFTAGIVAVRFELTATAPNDIGRLLENRDQNVALRGTIVSDPGFRDEPIVELEEAVADRHSFKLQLAAVQLSEGWQPAAGQVLVFVSALREPQVLRYGDVIECSAILRVPPPARNPGTFDWQAWLARQHIAFTATIRQTDDCRVLAHDRGNPVTALSLRLRERFERALRLGLEREPQLAGTLAGMVFGARAEIPPNTYADFQRTGVFHVFAINGLHVGLVTIIVLVFLRLLRVPRRWCGLVAIPLLVLYVFATGAHPGAVRALVMASVWLLGTMLNRPADGLNNLAVAAWALLVWEPTQLFDGGFLLSFAVVTAIVVLTPRIEGRLLPLVQPDPLVPGALVPWWRTKLAIGASRVVRLLSCSVAAWIGLVPLLAVYFHLFTPISIVANLLVIPLLSGIIALGLAATLAHAVWPWLTVTFNNANLFLLSVMTHGVDWLGRIPFGHQFVQAPPVWLTVLYYGVGVLLLSRWLSRMQKCLAAALAVVVVMWGAWPQEVIEITVLDLNDGVSVFVNLPGERDDWLIDGGGEWSGRRVVVPFLRAQGVDRLGAVLLTRGDKAHVAGLGPVLNSIPVREVIQSGLPTRSKYYDEWSETVKARRLPVRQVRAGDAWLAGGKLQVRVLNPPRQGAAPRSDDNALVLLLEFGPTRVLVMSDAGATVEQRLLNGGEDVRAQLVLKGRHGAEPSGTAAFLDAVQPAVVVQCVNVQSSRRYAEPGLAERVQQCGGQLLRTDETGAVMIRLTKNGYTIHTCFAGER